VLTKRFFIFLSILLISSFICLPSNIPWNVTHAVNDEGITIEMEGQSPILNDDKVQAEKMAIIDASRKAVEKVVGTLISSETDVKDFQLLQDTIKTRASGYVSNQEVLNSWEDHGYYNVLVRFTIKKAALEQSVDAYKLTLLKAGKPRLMVLMPNLEMVAKISQDMKNAGYPVVDPESIPELQNSTEAKFWNDQKNLSKLATNYQAEILIIGSIRQEPIGKMDGLFSDRAYLSIRAVRADTGQALASQTFNTRGVDLNDDLAFQKALNDATDQAIDYLKEQLGKALVDSERSLQISVDGVNYNDLQQLQRRLKATPNVENVFLRNFNNGNALLEVESGLLPDQLADLISSWKELNMEVINLSGSKIVLHHK
jgi:hypothetical protein